MKPSGKQLLTGLLALLGRRRLNEPPAPALNRSVVICGNLRNLRILKDFSRSQWARSCDCCTGGATRFFALVYPQIRRFSQIDRAVRWHAAGILCLTMNLVYTAPAML
jgi:hypothetical protein